MEDTGGGHERRTDIGSFAGRIDQFHFADFRYGSAAADAEECHPPVAGCRKIGEASARLACFDRESATLDEADRKNELTVMDKEDVRRTRRSIFGLNLSGLPFLGGDDKDSSDVKSSEEEEGARQITAKVASVRSLGYGKWAFDLDDGAHWVTTEAINSKMPAAGMTVVIKKGALGGFAASFDGSRQVKARRVN